MNDAFALTGRIADSLFTQGDALGQVLLPFQGVWSKLAKLQLSQNILQRKVGQDAGALAQHADELLRRVLHVRILQDVDAAIHLVVGSIYRNRSHAFFQDGGGF